MNLTQIKGNTWVLEGQEFIPLYRLDERRCVLLDNGLVQEQEELEESLKGAGLVPAGILCSHAHIDHCGNSAYLQRKYGIPEALTAPEAGMCANLLTLKCYFLTLPPETVAEESSIVHTPDVLSRQGTAPSPSAARSFTSSTPQATPLATSVRSRRTMCAIQLTPC